MANLTGKSEDSSGAVSFEQLALQRAGLTVSALSGKKLNGPSFARALDADDGSERKPSKTSTDFSQTNAQPKKDDDSYQTWMLITMMANQKADENDDLSSSGINEFVEMLDKFGIDTQPIKNIIEQVSGQKYSDFSANKGGHISTDDLFSYGQRSGRFSRDPGVVVSNGGFDSQRAIDISRSVGEAGYCARGTYKILHSMGYQVQSDNATKWDDNFRGNRNWVRMNVDPAHAPVGSVLVFNNDEQAGRGRNNNGHGAQFGHVEVVAETRNGHKMFVSDKPRDNWGGSVPQNYAGAYMYVGPNAPESNMRIASQMSTGHHAAPSLQLT